MVATGNIAGQKADTQPQGNGQFVEIFTENRTRFYLFARKDYVFANVGRVALMFEQT